MGLPSYRPQAAGRANFLHMMFSMPYEQHIAGAEVVNALN